MDYQKRYEEWLSKLDDNDPLKAELNAISNDEKEKEERFYQDLSFGTAHLYPNFTTTGKLFKLSRP